MSAELEKLVKNQTKLLSTLTDTIALLSVKIGKIGDKLDYRKQAQDERFLPPKNSQNRGED